jgi:membrane protein implicated in regulation of membrane protease activity
VAGELWQALCDAGADEGTVVEVAAVDGLLLVVERLPERG